MWILLCMLGGIVTISFAIFFSLEVALHPMRYAGAGPTAEESVIIEARHRRHRLLLGGGCVLGIAVIALGATGWRRAGRSTDAAHRAD